MKWKYANELQSLRGELCEISTTFVNNSMRRLGHKAQTYFEMLVGAVNCTVYKVSSMYVVDE